jgi:hypothetical protein
MRVFIAALFICVAVAPAGATWKPQYAAAPAAVRDWYENATLTAAAAKRLGFGYCCAHSEVVSTKFKVERRTDAWFYLDNGNWHEIPPDIIHWGESAPDEQPTLFRLSDGFADAFGLPHGTLTCFYPGRGGI